MGAAGSTVSAETADAVILVDRLDRLAEAMRLSRRALRIARQSVLAGMGLSIAAMALATAGYLPPLCGGAAARSDRRGGDRQRSAGPARQTARELRMAARARGRTVET
jgi:hypothetical protein